MGEMDIKIEVIDNTEAQTYDITALSFDTAHEKLYALEKRLKEEKLKVVDF